jgi:hypothetical protein
MRPPWGRLSFGQFWRSRIRCRGLLLDFQNTRWRGGKATAPGRLAGAVTHRAESSCAVKTRPGAE